MKKNLLTILILALLLVNIALTAIMMISVTSTNNKTAALVNTIATVMNLELTGNAGSGEEQAPSVSLADTEVYSLAEQMTILLKTEEDGKQTYMVFEIALSIDKNHADYKQYGGDNIKAYESLMRDAIVTVVSSKTATEVRNDMDGLKTDILKALQNLFDSDFIYKVSIGDVKFG